MGFKTPFLPENQPGDLIDFGFYKVQRHTKSAIIGMLKNFFDSINSTYKIQMPDIHDIQNSSDVQKIFVERDFPYKERKIPIILVTIKGATERKLYIGADNTSGVRLVETSAGVTVASDIYHGAADISLSLIVVCQTTEHRMKFAEMINMCFTHYYRWQYFYTFGDGNTFSIVPNTQQLEFGTESEATDVSPDSLLYITDISMKCFVEYTFTDSVNLHGILQEFTVDPTSGPVAQF